MQTKDHERRHIHTHTPSLRLQSDNLLFGTGNPSRVWSDCKKFGDRLSFDQGLFDSRYCSNTNNKRLPIGDFDDCYVRRGKFYSATRSQWNFKVQGIVSVSKVELFFKGACIYACLFNLALITLQ